jgi:drug/metabolite transporter (DMT)-like permease
MANSPDRAPAPLAPVPDVEPPVPTPVALSSTPGAAPGGQVSAAMIVATALWGSLPIASKQIVEIVSPAGQTLVRATSAFVILTLFCLVVAGPGPLRSALSRPRDIAVQGFLSFFASSMTNIMALEYISASLQSVLVSVFPVILALLAIGEGGVTPRALVGTLIALLGIVAVIGGDDPAAILAGGVDPRGVGLSLLTAVIIAGSQLWGQRQARRADPIGTTALAAGAALPFLLVTVAVQDGFGAIVAAPPTARLLLLYIGVFCTAINFGLWFWALKYVTAAGAAPIQYLSTPLSVLLAWYVLGEPLTVGLAVGTLLVLFGVFLTQSGRRRAGLLAGSREGPGHGAVDDPV